MKTPRFIAELATAVSGVRQGKNITYDDFAEIYLPLPPLEEQEAIAKHIDSLFDLANIHHRLNLSIKEEAIVAANEFVVGKMSTEVLEKKVLSHYDLGMK